ncbi:hypothetical protein B9Z55_026834 [Caenorhabditis nigoni]|nr:hypothetical protein B9Z55_026834 [Caenorhabditis nigoni]
MLEKPSEIQENRFMNSSNMFLTLPDVVLKEIMRKLSAREICLFDSGICEFGRFGEIERDFPGLLYNGTIHIHVLQNL